MKMLKKSVSFFLALVLVLLASPMSELSNIDFFTIKAEAAEYTGICGDNLTWTLDEETGTLTISGTGDMYDWNDVPWRNYRLLVKSVTIGDGVTSIGDYSFEGCTGLESVTIPDSVISIGVSAFLNCNSLTSVTIPDLVTSIGNYTFYSCDSLTSVTIGNSVTSIGNYAFYSCDSLTSVIIPDSVTSIGTDAFYDTAYYNNTSNWENDVLYIDKHLIKAKITISGEYTIKSGTLTIAGSAFRSCDSLTSVTIGNSVTSIGEYAFFYCNSLTSVTIGDSVTSIGSSAFEWCYSLTSVTIGNSVTSIGWYAFSDCDSLTSVTIPNSVTSIDKGAFSGCNGLTSVTIPDSVTSIGDEAFCYCSSLTSITVDEINAYYSNDEYGVLFNEDKTELIQYPIGNTRMSYTIPDSVTSIGSYAFEDCDSLTSITIPDSVTSIGYRAFNDTPYYDNTSNWENDVLYIGKHLIKAKTTITSDYTIKSGTLTVAKFAFSYCYSLTSVIIGNSVTSIGSYAFIDCDSLTDIYYNGTEEEWNEIEIGSYNDDLLNANLHFGVECLIEGDCGENLKWTFDKMIGELVITGTGDMTNWSYTSDTPWKDYYSDIKSVTIENGVTSIGDYAFEWCYNLTDITIPNSVKSIGDSAFYACGNLTSISIPNSVKGIGDSAFNSCGNLTSITIPDSVISIGTHTFASCESITSVTIGNSVTSIGDGAFYYCTGLTSLQIPSSVTDIGDNVFRNCNGITQITVDENNAYYSNDDCGALFDKRKTEIIKYPTGNNRNIYAIPTGVKVIDAYAFEICDKLISITIPNSVVSVGEYAFANCANLTNIIIPDSVISIGDYAFSACESITSVKIPDTVTSIGDSAFNYCNNLTSIMVDEDNAYYSSDEYGVLFNKGKTELIRYPIGNTRNSYTVPNTVVSIYDEAFSYCKSITNVVIPNSVTSIGRTAFYWCSRLTSITIPDYVTSIDDFAFGICQNLKSVIIPKSVKIINYYAFYECTDLTDVYYTGTEEQWSEISVYSSNECLLNATIHFNYVASEDAEIELPEGSEVIIKDTFIIGLPMNITQENISDYIPVTGGGSIVCDSDMIGTGTVVQIVDADGEVIDEYELVFTGDINGDIIISTSDFVTLKSMCSGAVEIPENTAYWYAADLNYDGMVTSTDMTMIRSIINGEI